MVHVVYRFGEQHPQDPAVWCILCTIFPGALSKTRQIGASGAPFLLRSQLKLARMVYVVHHFGGRRSENPENGASSAPFQLSRYIKPARMAHIVHHFACTETGNEKDRFT